MKKLILTLLILIVLGLLLFLGLPYYQKSTSSLSKATKAESGGQLQIAYDHYINALIDISPSTKIPDFNKSKVVEGKIWKSDIMRYVTFLRQTTQKSVDFTHVLNKINNYNDRYSHSECKVVNMSRKLADTAVFFNEWKNTFYAPSAPFNPSDLDIAYEVYSKNGSFLKLSADKGFTYEIYLINTSSGIQTNFTVFSEGVSTALVFPGEYLLLCRSSVAFSTSEIWKSSTSIASLTIPDNTSILSGMLITKVSKTR